MKLIVVRGLPGSGKTTISNRLAEDLGGETLHIDYLKTQITKRFPDQYDRHQIRSLAYEATLEHIKSKLDSGADLIILDELFIDKKFVEDIISLCAKESIEIQWFRLERHFDKLLEVENSAERQSRAVKNSREDLEKLAREMDENKIEGEIVIENNLAPELALAEIKRELKLENPGAEIEREFRTM